jgi:hypothetical protein
MWILQIILILFPGQSDLAAYPLTEKSIKSALAEGTEFRIEYFIEYMDCYRNSDQKPSSVNLQSSFHMVSYDRCHWPEKKGQTDQIRSYHIGCASGL